MAALRYLLLGLLVAAVVIDADGKLHAGYVLLGAAGAVLVYVAWRMLRNRPVRSMIARLESDPDTQYSVHRWGVLYWLINFPIVAWLFFFHRSFWETVGIFITLVYSVYANLATDYGAMSAALAAKGVQPPPEIPLEER